MLQVSASVPTEEVSTESPYKLPQEAILTSCNQPFLSPPALHPRQLAVSSYPTLYLVPLIPNGEAASLVLSQSPQGRLVSLSWAPSTSRSVAHLFTLCQLAPGQTSAGVWQVNTDPSTIENRAAVTKVVEVEPGSWRGGAFCPRYPRYPLPGQQSAEEASCPLAVWDSDGTVWSVDASGKCKTEHRSKEERPPGSSRSTKVCGCWSEDGEDVVVSYRGEVKTYKWDTQQGPRLVSRLLLAEALHAPGQQLGNLRAIAAAAPVPGVASRHGSFVLGVTTGAVGEMKASGTLNQVCEASLLLRRKASKRAGSDTTAAEEANELSLADGEELEGVVDLTSLRPQGSGNGIPPQLLLSNLGQQLEQLSGVRDLRVQPLVTPSVLQQQPAQLVVMPHGGHPYASAFPLPGYLSSPDIIACSQCTRMHGTGGRVTVVIGSNTSSKLFCVDVVSAPGAQVCSFEERSTFLLPRQCRPRGICLDGNSVLVTTGVLESSGISSMGGRLSSPSLVMFSLGSGGGINVNDKNPSTHSCIGAATAATGKDCAHCCKCCPVLKDDEASPLKLLEAMLAMEGRLMLAMGKLEARQDQILQALTQEERARATKQ